jgi:hypothetical protein
LTGQAGECPVDATERQLDLGYNVLSCLKSTPLYARVDIVEDENQHPFLIELELIEPSLFLSASLPSVQRFAEAILRRR